MDKRLGNARKKIKMKREEDQENRLTQQKEFSYLLKSRGLDIESRLLANQALIDKARGYF